MDYRARYYDPYINRFIQADTIVPEPGSSQAYNRYMYVSGNPLRYTDPTGNYSEEEIMQAFGVTTWEEVLAYFNDQDSVFHNRWGWLEVLRRAEDGYLVSGDVWEIDGWNLAELYEGEHKLRRDDNGRIMVGEFDQGYFANHHVNYVLHTPSGNGTFATAFDKMWLYWSITKSPVTKTDKETIAQDVVSIALEGVGAVTAPSGVGLIVFEVAQGSWDAFVGTHSLLNSFDNLTVYKKTYCGYTSDDILGVAGITPIAGVLTDVIDIFSHATGIKVEWRP